MTISMSSDLLCAREVAALIDRTPRRVNQLAVAGRLRPVAEVIGSDGRAWRMFTLDEVHRYQRATR